LKKKEHGTAIREWTEKKLRAFKVVFMISGSSPCTGLTLKCGSD